MKRDEVMAVISSILKNEYDYKGDVSDETHLIQDASLDSLDTVEFIMKVEKEFDISVADSEAEKVSTAGQACDLVMAKLEKK